MEKSYPTGTCGYCMKTGRQIMKLGCGLAHGYCCDCIESLIKVTRIKKGLVERFMYTDAAKCPKCNEIVVVAPGFTQEIKAVKDVQDKKEELKL